MEKAERYGSLIKDYLVRIAELCNRDRSSAPNDVRTEVIFDDVHHQYLLIDIGWVGESRVRSIVIYVRLRDGKIWIEQDMTGEGIGNVLLEHGVPRQDMVLAFQSPKLRQLAELATA
jgi:XisI protein